MELFFILSFVLCQSKLRTHFCRAKHRPTSCKYLPLFGMSGFWLSRRSSSLPHCGIPFRSGQIPLAQCISCSSTGGKAEGNTSSYVQCSSTIYFWFSVRLSEITLINTIFNPEGLAGVSSKVSMAKNSAYVINIWLADSLVVGSVKTANLEPS